MASNSSQQDITSPSSFTFPPQASLAGRYNSASHPFILRCNRQTLQFFVNAWVFVVATLAMFPYLPTSFSNRAYRLSFIGTLFSSLYSLFSLYGIPQAWNFVGMRIWFWSIVVAKDFLSFIYCLIFVCSHICFKFSLITILCRAASISAMFLGRNFSSSPMYRKYLEAGCVWVGMNATTLRFLSSHAEIALGFLLILSMLWKHTFLQTFLYWLLLRLMYQAPATAHYHRFVWIKIGRIVNFIVHNYVPFLNVPISTVRRWCMR